MRYKGYFARKSEQNKKTSVKVAIITVAILAIFLPAIIAGIVYSLKSNTIDTPNETLMQVSLYSGDTLLHEEKENPKNAVQGGLVAIFDLLSKNGTPTDNIPNDVYGRKMLKAVISYDTVVSEYRCYFATDGTRSYFVDAAEKKYVIDESSATLFMDSVYSETLYRCATPPELYTTSKDAVIPASADWNYKTVSGKLLKAENITLEKDELTYDMAGTLGISFEEEPDSCSVKIYKSGIIIHDITDYDLSLITVEPGTTLQLKVTAIWNQADNRRFYGEVSYNFKVLVRNRSEFILDKTEFEVGDLAVVSCTNILDIEKIQFKSEPDIGFEPKFFKDSDMVYALIPFDYGLKVGKYIFTFSYGATIQTVSVDLTPPVKSTSAVTVTNEQSFSNTVRENSLNKLSTIINELGDEYAEYIFFRNAFADYTADGATVLYGYGTLFNAPKINLSHVTKGTYYTLSCDGGATVGALNGGTVIYSGSCEYLGNFVVIEHGLGLRTCYGHLSSLNVSKGDFVARGQTIGRTGFAPDSELEGVFVMCYVFDTPIDYTRLAGKTPELFLPKNEAKDN